MKLKMEEPPSNGAPASGRWGSPRNETNMMREHHENFIG
jgi:hypothetical protein